MQWKLPDKPTAPFCPSEVQGAVIVPPMGNLWRKLLAFLGPGLLVSVGYMDPGNWGTDIAGGSRFGYSLLSVIFLSNLMAIVLQTLCVRLWLVTGNRTLMGTAVSPRWLNVLAWAIGLLIAGLNVWLLWQTIADRSSLIGLRVP